MDNDRNNKQFRAFSGCVLFFSDDGEEIIRIISARHANPNERSIYEKY
jgi:uncharacterized DUF497 family protein